MAIDEQDLTGEPPSNRDIEEALQVITRLMVDIKMIATLPPQILVQVPNIRRCLLELRRLRDRSG